MEKCVKNVERIARAMGATIDMQSDYTIYADAPPGYVWTSVGSSCLAEPCDNGSQRWVADACRDLIDDMRMGLDQCNDAHADELTNDRGEDWHAPPGAPMHIPFPDRQRSQRVKR